MAREILFRGKRKDNGEWIYGDLRQWSETSMGICDRDLKHTFPVRPETVGQFTGTTDKTGAPLYEGDIVTFSGLTRFTVEYSTCRMGFYFSRLPNGGCIPGFTMAAWEHLEIIGNIHDNPELLNGTES